jgi:hypothetical protein
MKYSNQFNYLNGQELFFKYNSYLKINELTIKVNDIKGKFIKPALKKVNKTQSK